MLFVTPGFCLPHTLLFTPARPLYVPFLLVLAILSLLNCNYFRIVHVWPIRPPGFLSTLAFSLSLPHTRILSLSQVAVFNAAFACLLITLGFAVSVFMCRGNSVIKAASSRLCVVMLVALFFMAGGAVFYAISPEHGTWVCVLRQLLAGVPTALFMAMLIVKTMRIQVQRVEQVNNRCMPLQAAHQVTLGLW